LVGDPRLDRYEVRSDDGERVTIHRHREVAINRGVDDSNAVFFALEMLLVMPSL
jgi:hypothetical protein